MRIPLQRHLLAGLGRAAPLLLLALTWLLGAVPAHAGAYDDTVTVVVDVEDGPLPESTVRSVLWHALYAEHGHRAAFVDALDASAVQRMRGSPMTTLLHVEVSWRPDTARVERESGDVYLVGGHYPVIDTTEYALEGDALTARYTWHTEGPISVFQVRGDTPNQFISMPEISLQETVSLAVRPLHAPLWRDQVDTIQIPVVLAADDDYRAFYGEQGWRDVAARAVDRANALLGEAGLELTVVHHESWTSPADETDLSVLLEAMAARPLPARRPFDRALRIGFTAQTQLAVAWDADMEDVGRAYLPGRDLLIADQAAHPGHDPAWDVAEEGVAVAHEVLHALGIPHAHEPDLLMSETKRGSVYRMSPATVELARAAASSRYTHWDALAALTALSQSAETHLASDLELQLDYISDNLAYGAGVPDPGALEPGRLSALTNVAVSRYYLERAQEDPSNAWQLRQGAQAHVDSALAQAPTWKEARQLSQQVQALAPPSPPDKPVEPTLDEIATSIYGGSDDDPWALPERTCQAPTRGTCD